MQWEWEFGRRGLGRLGLREGPRGMTRISAFDLSDTGATSKGLLSRAAIR